MILRKSQVHLPQHKIGLIEFQSLSLFCRAEMFLIAVQNWLESYVIIYV